MVKIYECDQQSLEWDELHIGRATASGFDKIITTEGKKSAQWKKYAHGIIAEKLLKRRIEAFSNQWMERGHEIEHEAVSQYEFLKDTITHPVGFMTDDEGKWGCSPDRLVGEEGLLEIKSPKPNTFVGYLLEEEIAKEYKAQIQGQLFISGREWVDIMSFHPELTQLPCIVRVERDPTYITLLKGYLTQFNEYLDDSYIKIAARLGNGKHQKDMIEELLKGEIYE